MDPDREKSLQEDSALPNPHSGLDGAKLAVTVLMVRDSVDGIEVYVQERSSSMRTFPNVTVFPGGGVDPRDFEVGDTDPTMRLGLMRWARVFGTNRNVARALLFAAVRELFEETGTLLANYGNGAPVMDGKQFHQERLALESHEYSLSEIFQQRDLLLRTDLLRPFARWVSPKSHTYRFDVYSLLAVAPLGQQPDANTAEATSSGWFSPQIILDGWHAGLVELVLPTWAQLVTLSKYRFVEDLLNQSRRADMSPIMNASPTDPRYKAFFEHDYMRRF